MNSIHEKAVVDSGAVVGDGTSIWHFAHVRSGATIGSDCILGHAVYVDEGVTIGDRCKIQNKVSIYNGVTIANDVFIGPHACFTNDLHPRAFNDEWKITSTVVERGASIGAQATIRCGITIGEFAMIGAGAVVTKDVPPFGLVLGVPGKISGSVCYCGRVVSTEKGTFDGISCKHDPHFDVSKFS